MAYDHVKAARLDEKARRLLNRHRRHVWGPKAELHLRAIVRIKNLMGPHWRYARSVKAGERLAGMGY